MILDKMFLKIIFPCCSVITFTTWLSLSLMLTLNMSFQIACCRSSVFTLITRISHFFMFPLNMPFQRRRRRRGPGQRHLLREGLCVPDLQPLLGLGRRLRQKGTGFGLKIWSKKDWGSWMSRNWNPLRTDVCSWVWLGTWLTLTKAQFKLITWVSICWK